MKLRLRLLIALPGMLGLLIAPGFVFAQTAVQHLQPDEYVRAVVLGKDDAPSEEAAVDGVTSYRIRLTSGAEKGKELTIKTSEYELQNRNRTIEPGDAIVIVKSYQISGGAEYYLADNYRLPVLLWLAAGFFALAVVFGGLRGFTSMLGLAASVAVILGYVVPQILMGGDPFHATMVGTFAIAALSLYLAHGFNKRIHVAFAGTLITLVLSAGFAVLAVSIARMYGMGNEEALYLQNGDFGDIDLRGLLLGGIMLGVLGVLDDITTAQSAVVEELKRANPALTFSELNKRALSVGREHIASLVNTLFLAYAGAAMPLFLLFAAYKEQPVWYLLNSELLSEEIVRTLVGSVCLILAVPITTALAAFVFSRTKPDPQVGDRPHGHSHG